MDDGVLQPLVDIRDIVGGDRIVAFALGPAGEAVMLAVAASDVAVATGQRRGRSRMRLPKLRPGRYSASVIVAAADGIRVKRLERLAALFPIVQLLPDDRVLIAATRRERGTAIYASDGSLERKLVLGDGIEDVQTTHEGAIWVSYFDEGIFGGGSGPESSGLARFNDQGENEWTFEPPPNVGSIDDCYALNVTADAVWAYYHSAFPLVRISGDAVEAWKTPVAGARAVAVGRDKALFIGGYNQDRFGAVLCRFAEQRLVEERRLKLRTTKGDLSPDAPIAARGSAVYVLDGSTVFAGHMSG